MTTTSKRTDCHRPSAIDATAYEFVGVEYCRDQGDLGAALMAQEERKRIQQHMTRTGDTYSKHQHGGNCHVCGAHAIYTVLWYHESSRSYVRTGEDCAEHLWSDDTAAFRRVISKLDSLRGIAKDVRDNKAGQRKAEALLSDAGLLEAWQLFSMSDDEKTAAGLIKRVYYETDDEGEQYTDHACDQLRTLEDIVRKLVKWGSISEAQQNYLRKLVDYCQHKQERDAARDATRKAERDAAEDCPTGRIVISGQVVKTDEQETNYGRRYVMTVKDDRGFLVWGSIPSQINPSKGARVTFTGTVEQSDRDSKFGFYKRPTKAEIIE